jgi:peptidyl-prolyl cis-trans isomerase C
MMAMNADQQRVKKYFFVLIALGFMVSNLFYQLAYASSTDRPVDVDFFATVNGAPLTNGLLEINLKNALNQGQKSTPELTANVKQELINRELLTQEAVKKNLDKAIDFRDQFTQLKQTLLIQALVEDHFAKEPMTDSVLHAEYDRQKQVLGDSSNTYQYRISQIVVANESDAADLIRRLQKGELFGKLAQEYSSDTATKNQGGQLGWVLAPQLVGPVARAVTNLNKGAISASPIQTSSGWVVLRLDDKRSFKFPSFEEAKPQLRQALVQQFLAEQVKQLRESAKIVE